MKRLIAILLVGLLAVSGAAQFTSLPPAKKRAVFGADYYVSPSQYDYSGVARRIVGDAQTNYEKALRIYVWLCENVTFDNTNQIRTADETWRSRKAVCQGYCELFYRLAAAVGVKTKLVYGKARLPIASAPLQDHVWLAIETERGEVLADPTWGAGHFARGTFVRMQQPLLWFDVDGAWFIFSHYPKNDRRQHLDPTVSRADFDRLPYMTPLSAALGIKGNDALRHLLDGGETYPVVRVQDGAWLQQIALVGMPRTHTLQADSAYTFTVKKLSADAGTLSIAHGPTTYAEPQWQCADSTFTITLTPHTAGPLYLTLQVRQGVLVRDQRIVEYEVR